MSLRQTVHRTIAYELLVVRRTWLEFWEQDSRHLWLEAVAVAAAGVVSGILHYGSIDREWDRFLASVGFGLGTLISAAMILFLVRLAIQPSKLWSQAQQELAELTRGEEKPLSIRPSVGNIADLWPDSLNSADYEILPILSLEVTNTTRRTVSQLIGRLRYIPIQGDQVSIYTKWVDSKDRHTVISPGDRRRLLLAYAKTDRSEFYPADLDLAPWKRLIPNPAKALSFPLLIEARLTANDIDQRFWIALRFAVREGTPHPTARVVTDNDFGAWREKGIEPLESAED